MNDLVNECIQHFSVNRPGPVKYLNCYRDYYYILDDTAKQELLQFFGQEPAPYLKVCAVVLSGDQVLVLTVAVKYPLAVS